MVTYIPIRLVPIQKMGYHILIQAFVNDHPLDILIDTGASLTVFNQESISSLTEAELIRNEHESFGIGASSIESYGTIITSFRLGDLEIRNYMAALMDLTAINDTYSLIGNGRIDGLLGGDILKKYHAAIDYKTRHLKLRYRIRK